MAEFHELVFEGPLPVVRAFLTGLRLGKGWATSAICSEDHDIQGDSLGHRVLETIKLTKDLTHVLVLDRHVRRRALRDGDPAVAWPALHAVPRRDVGLAHVERLQGLVDPIEPRRKVALPDLQDHIVRLFVDAVRDHLRERVLQFFTHQRRVDQLRRLASSGRFRPSGAASGADEGRSGSIGYRE